MPAGAGTVEAAAAAGEGSGSAPAGGCNWGPVGCAFDAGGVATGSPGGALNGGGFEANNAGGARIRCRSALIDAPPGFDLQPQIATKTKSASEAAARRARATGAAKGRKRVESAICLERSIK
ncbi:MAG TPA: hypothetical protein VGJ26_07010 [Pirellulales bacterium]